MVFYVITLNHTHSIKFTWQIRSIFRKVSGIDYGQARPISNEEGLYAKITPLILHVCEMLSYFITVCLQYFIIFSLIANIQISELENTLCILLNTTGPVNIFCLP